MPVVNKSNLEDVAMSILTSQGVPTEYAEIVTESIIYAHEREKHTHGIGRIPIYIRKINQGLMEPSAEIIFKTDYPVVANIDAGNGFGQVAGKYAMDEAIQRARKFGIGMVGVANSNNFGTAGFLGEMATKQGMIGIVMGNSAPAIAPTGGKISLLGTNPLCYAFPRGEKNPPIVLDMACSVAARGKIRLADKNGDRIPFGWAVNDKGEATDNPAEALKGSLMPIGGAKGYGLSLAVDIIAGLLTGSSFGGEVKPLNHPDESSRYGHMCIVINIEFFLDKVDYENNIETLVLKIKSCGVQDEVMLPGEKSYRKSKKWTNTIFLPERQFSEINTLTKNLNLKYILVEV